MHFDEYRQYDGLGLRGLLDKREVTSDELLDLAIERKNEVNPKINAVTINDEAYAREHIKEGEIPILLKDLYGFLEGTLTSQGSRMFEGFRAPSTSTFVNRIRQNGFIPFGKTSSPELGCNVVTEPVLHGPCRNPWSFDHSPGGSSGGAGAAVAAGIVPVAHASDGGGSIRIPASNCGLVGLKPSRARNPTGPDIGEAWNGMAGSHFLTRTVRDQAWLLDLISGPEPGDPYACPEPEHNFLSSLRDRPKRLKIGMSTTSPLETVVHEDCVKAVEILAKHLEGMGHEVHEAAPEMTGRGVGTKFWQIISVNFANDMDFWSRALNRPANADTLETMSLAMIEEGRKVTGQQFAIALTAIQKLARSFGRYFEKYDLWLTPTLGTPPPAIGHINQNGHSVSTFFERTYEHIPFTPLYNATGCPAISLPVHVNAQGLPVGAMLGARLGGERTLLKVSQELEEELAWFGRYSVI